MTFIVILLVVCAFERWPALPLVLAATLLWGALH